ncbi:MAG: DUF1232 domain-containing protein [bacterium]|nr:DUF1232 domain-containing protein [bacterium]
MVRLLRWTVQEVRYYRTLAADPRTPRAARWLLGAALAYLLFPLDIIPDFIPVLGHLDEAFIVPALIWAALALIPSDVKLACRARAAECTTGRAAHVC